MKALFLSFLVMTIALTGCNTDASHKCIVASMPQDTTVSIIRLSELVDTSAVCCYPLEAMMGTTYTVADRYIGVITNNLSTGYILERNSNDIHAINYFADGEPRDLCLDEKFGNVYIRFNNGYLVKYDITSNKLRGYMETKDPYQIFSNPDGSTTLINLFSRLYKINRPYFMAATVTIKDDGNHEKHYSTFQNLKDKAGIQYYYCNTGQATFGWSACDTLFYYDPYDHNLYPRFVLDITEKRPEIVITVELKDRFLTKFWPNHDVVETDKGTSVSRYVKIENDLKLDSSPTIDPEAFKDGYYSFMTDLDNFDKPLSFPPKEGDNKVLVVVPLKLRY